MLGKTRMEKQDRLLSLQEREDLNQRLKIRTGNKRVRARVTESRQDVSDLFGKFPVHQTITVAADGHSIRNFLCCGQNRQFVI